MRRYLLAVAVASVPVARQLGEVSTQVPSGERVLLGDSLVVPATPPATPRVVSPQGYPSRRLPSGKMWKVDKMGADTTEALDISAPFWMGETEVTQALWDGVHERDPTIPANPSEAIWKDISLQHPQYPVQNVSWCEAVAFANALSRLEGMAAAYAGTERCEETAGVSVKRIGSADGWHLPTGDEWEWSARAAGQHRRYAGAEEDVDACEIGNVYGPQTQALLRWGAPYPCSDSHLGLAEVGVYRANAWGLLDMTGNVREWTEDPGSGAGTSRAFRGGGWHGDPIFARIGCRIFEFPSFRYNDLGLRLSRSFGPGRAADPTQPHPPAPAPAW